MGAVYRARDTKLGRSVAIKVLLPEVASDAERLARFAHEAKTLAALNHPNIAQIYGLEDGPNGPFLVMEFVEGERLDAWCRGSSPSLLRSRPRSRRSPVTVWPAAHLNQAHSNPSHVGTRVTTPAGRTPITGLPVKGRRDPQRRPVGMVTRVLTWLGLL